MKYFLDTEFNDNIPRIDLISAGVVAEDGREWYGVIEEYTKPSTRRSSCNSWVKDNVITKLQVWDKINDGHGVEFVLGEEDDLRYGLTNFIGNDPFPEFWAYYGHHDWVLITQLWGGFTYLPKKWPHACYDLHQFAKQYKLERSLPDKLTPEHNSLIDARWTKYSFDYVLKKSLSIERKWP